MAWVLPLAADIGAGLEEFGVAAEQFGNRVFGRGVVRGFKGGARWLNKNRSSILGGAGGYLVGHKRRRTDANSAIIPTPDQGGSVEDTDVGLVDTHTMSGYYRGRVRAPRRVVPAGPYSLYGFKLTNELSGTSSTGNRALGIGFRSVLPKEIAGCVGAAFLRHLLKREYHVDITHPRQLICASFIADQKTTDITGLGEGYMQLPAPTSADSVTYIGGTTSVTVGTGANQVVYPAIDRKLIHSLVFHVERLDENGRYTIECSGDANGSNTASPMSTTYYFKPDSTLLDFADWFANRVLRGVFGTSANSAVRLKAVQFIENDFWKEGGWQSTPYGALRPRAVISLDRLYVKAKCHVAVKLQNITKADDGSLSTDRVDINPLQGRYYHHTNTLPRFSDLRRMGTVNDDVSMDKTARLTDGEYTVSGTTLTDTGPDDGIVVYRQPSQGPFAATQGGRSPVEKIPPPDYFRNVSHTAKMLLNPGEIKVHSLTFKFDGLIWKFPLGFNEKERSTPGEFVTIYNNLDNNFGTCDMFWFEQILSSGQNTVEIGYEVTRSVAAVVKKQRSVPIMPYQNIGTVTSGGT